MDASRWRRWREHFEHNAEIPLPVAAADDFVLRDPPLRALLLRTLTILQRAETGEGRVARAIERVRYANIDDDYRAALRGFVCEEARHAGVLGRLLGAYGAGTTSRGWRDDAFEGIRGLAGVRLKLFVFLVAEVAAVYVFEAITAGLPDGSARRVLGRLLRDEEGHLAFHAEFFRTAVRGGVARGLLALAVWCGGALACLAMLLDHRRLLRRLGHRHDALVQRAFATAARARQLALGARPTGRGGTVPETSPVDARRSDDAVDPHPAACGAVRALVRP